MFSVALVSLVIALPVVSMEPRGYYETLRPEVVALGEPGVTADQPRPRAGFEALAGEAAGTPRRPVRGHRNNRRMIRKLTWV